MGNFLRDNGNRILGALMIPVAAVALNACSGLNLNAREAGSTHVTIDRAFKDDGTMVSIYYSNFAPGESLPTMVISECQGRTRLDVVQKSEYGSRAAGSSVAIAANAPECADGKLTADDFS